MFTAAAITAVVLFFGLPWITEKIFDRNRVETNRGLRHRDEVDR